MCFTETLRNMRFSKRERDYFFFVFRDVFLLSSSRIGVTSSVTYKNFAPLAFGSVIFLLKCGCILAALLNATLTRLSGRTKASASLFAVSNWPKLAVLFLAGLSL